MSQIYALLSVKFPGLKICECKKMTNIRYDHDYRLVLMIFIISWQQLAEIMTIDPQGPFTAGDHGGCTYPIPGLIFHPI